MEGACDCLECRMDLEELYAEYLHSASDIKDGMKMKVERKDVYAFEGIFPSITCQKLGFFSSRLKLDKFEDHSLTVKKLSIDHYSKDEKDIKAN